MRKVMITFLIGALGMLSLSCTDDSNTNENRTSRMQVRLVDGPGDYDNVFVDVENVTIKYEAATDLQGEAEVEENEIEIGEVEAGIYDLLELTGGTYAMLTEDDIPAGRINQIRLILGSENSIVVDGQTYSLSTPSAQQSGLKVQLNQTLEADTFYTFVLDFDVEESIVAEGDGSYSLKPVIRASAIEQSGEITGTIITEANQSVITATGAGVEVNTYASDNGEFVLNGLPEGTYDLSIDSEISTGVSATATVTDVVVVNGETTAVGEISVE